MFLHHANPKEWAVHATWQPLVNAFWQSPDGQALQVYLSQRLEAGARIFPPEPLRALWHTPLSRVRVVLLGQDPYHAVGQAQGLSFSVAQGLAIPPSLRNIFKEMHADLGLQPPMSGSLVPWADRGVLLLNTCLTVEEGRPASHAGQGWEALTDAIISAVAKQPQPTVFLLWGAHAQSKRHLIEVDEAMQKEFLQAAPFANAGKFMRSEGVGNLLLEANHPSPLSALRGPNPFMGCKHFSMAQAWLRTQGVDFQWDLEE